MLYSCFRITKTICKPNQFYNQKLSSNFRKRQSRYKTIESPTETMTAPPETMAAKYKTIESPP